MIIFGWRGITYVKNRGTFYCPQCNGEQAYERKRVRRFFTLYFIPVIPLSLAGEFIECRGCGGSFRENVLSYDPRAERAHAEVEFQRAMKRVMVQMMMADGRIEDSEIATICTIYASVAGSDLSEADVRKEIGRVESAKIGFADALAEMGKFLNEDGKELVVKAAFMVAAADGVLKEEETSLLSQIAGGIGMTPAHFRGLMSDLTPPE